MNTLFVILCFLFLIGPETNNSALADDDETYRGLKVFADVIDLNGSHHVIDQNLALQPSACGYHIRPLDLSGQLGYDLLNPTGNVAHRVKLRGDDQELFLLVGVSIPKEVKHRLSE